MNKLLLVAMMFTVVSAQALDNDKSGIPVKDREGIEAQLKEELAEHIRSELMHFNVDWSPSSLKCAGVEQHDIDLDVTGICTVNISAFHVTAKALIIKKYRGYSVAIVDAVVSEPS